MGKISYVIRRIKDMSYKGFFDTINLVHKKSGRNRVILFFDIIYCGFKYQAGYSDYKLYEMYNLNGKERKTEIFRGSSLRLCPRRGERQGDPPSGQQRLHDGSDHAAPGLSYAQRAGRADCLPLYD